MGWGRTFLLGDIGNRLDIEDTEKDISQLKQALAGKQNLDAAQDQAIDQLIYENEQLKLYMGSLLRLLVAKNVVSAEELTAFVDLIDSD